MDKPNDPVIDFILDPTTRKVVMDGSDHWPYSKLSASRVSKVGYKLIVLRCAQISANTPTRTEVEGWLTTRR